MAIAAVGLILSACGGGNDSNVTYDEAQPHYTENGSLVLPNVQHIWYVPTQDPLTDIERNNLTYNPPPANVDIAAFTASSQIQPAAFSTVITYLDGKKNIQGVSCAKFPDEGKAAVATALNIWSSILNSPVPIRVDLCWGILPANVGGGGAPVAYAYDEKNQILPIALANALSGYDREPNKSDIQVTLNASLNWHFSPILPIPTNQQKTHFDLTTILLHELGHGLGFISFIRNESNYWSWGNNVHSIYDSFMRDGNNQSIVNRTLYPQGSAKLSALMTSNNIWFSGANAINANSGGLVKIRARPTSASSAIANIHHLDDIYMTGNNRLMTWMVGFGDRNHNPGSIAIGVLKDLGWGRVTTTKVPPMAVLVNPTGVSATSTPIYTWKPSLGSTDYYIQVINRTNNAVIFQSWLKATATCLSSSACSYRPALALSRGNYMWRIIAKNNYGNAPSSAYMSFTVN